MLEDLCCFLPEDKAKAAISVLDIDGDGKISPDDMRDAVVSIYKERKHLALTLRVISLCTALLLFLHCLPVSLSKHAEGTIIGPDDTASNGSLLLKGHKRSGGEAGGHICCDHPYHLCVVLPHDL